MIGNCSLSSDKLLLNKIKDICAHNGYIFLSTPNFLGTDEGKDRSKDYSARLYKSESFIKLIKSEIFENNPNIFQELEEDIFVFPIVLNNPQTNYCKEDTPVYAKHRFDKHIIEQICEVYGIPDPELRCELYFTHEESEKVTNLLSDVGVKQGTGWSAD